MFQMNRFAPILSATLLNRLLDSFSGVKANINAVLPLVIQMYRESSLAAMLRFS